MAAKEEEARKEEILRWMEQVMEEEIPRQPAFEKVLKDGTIICRLINKLAPGSVKNIKTKGSNFQLMENHSNFQKALKKYGVPGEEIFQTADLFEARNIKAVVKGLYALARTATNRPDYTGPSLGPKMSAENKREFTQEQLEAGKYVVNTKQMGSNEGASQSGMNIGQGRTVTGN